MPTALKKGESPRAERFRAIDWLRGLSVLVMIECHALFFIQPELEASPFWKWIQGWNGLVSVSFLFAAGFAAGLVGTRQIANAPDAEARRARSRKTLVRIAQVLAISLFFRVSSSLGDPASLGHLDTLKHLGIAILKFDILVCICAGLLAVWAAMMVCRSRVGLAAAMVGVLLITSLALTPWATAYRGNPIITGWLNSSTGSMFTPFPFAAYLLLGAMLGIGAARASGGRRVVVGGLVVTTIAGYLLGETRVAIDWWHSLGTWEYMMPLPNLFERMWKLGVIGLVLFGIERAWPTVGRLLAPGMAVLEFFSRHALAAFFVHLSLLYGFLGIHFTHQWHRNSSWPQYAWRLAALYGMTVLLCLLIERVKQAIIATADRTRATQLPVPAPEAA